MIRDWQGYGKPHGFWVGYGGVRVRVKIFYPSKTHTLTVGFRGIGVLGQSSLEAG